MGREVITLKELKDKIKRKRDFILVDILTPSRYAEAHIPGAINIFFWDLEKRAESELPALKEIILYCSSIDCDASQRAREMLLKKGFTDVRYYAGGIDEWMAAGEPIKKGELP